MTNTRFLRLFPDGLLAWWTFLALAGTVLHVTLFIQSMSKTSQLEMAFLDVGYVMLIASLLSHASFSTKVKVAMLLCLMSSGLCVVHGIALWQNSWKRLEVAAIPANGIVTIWGLIGMVVNKDAKRFLFTTGARWKHSEL